MDIDSDGFTSLMDPETNEEKSDLKLPEGELGDQIRAALEKADDVSVNVSLFFFSLLL